MPISRRNFLHNSALTATGFMIVPRHVLGGSSYVAPSDKVNIALVGAGGRGRRNASALMALEDVQITSIADPAEYWDLANFYYRSKAGRRPVKEMIEEHYGDYTPYYQISAFEDFREMLEKEKSIDGILCATPDHTHAYVSLMAMSAGKHVYCEKPLTHNIWEARQLKKMAKESGLATQMGNQLHSTEAIRQTVECLKAGILGKIHQVHAWVPATRWVASLKGVPTETHPLPKGLNWDLWLGPRAEREFHETYAPVSWRDYWDFGCGAMGDFGCHDLDAAVWGMDLPAPESVVLHAAGYSDKDITPYGEIGYYKFPGGKGRDPLSLNWYSGGLKPERPETLPEDFDLPRRGSMYIGEKGIMVYGSGPKPKLFPESLQTEADALSPSLALTNGHHRDWIDAIKGGPAASSHFEYGAHLTEITLLGVLSLRLGNKKIEWDAENMKAKGLPEADAFIEESVRKGWEMKM